MHDNPVTLRVGTFIKNLFSSRPECPGSGFLPQRPAAPRPGCPPLSGGHRVVRTAPEIVSMMRAVAPPGQPGLDQATLDRLSELTRALRAAVPSAAAEYAPLAA